jgi:hypothetical protein
MPLIDSEDARLTAREKNLIRTIAIRLEAKPMRPPLPETYARELDRVFGSHCEAEVNRWEQ